MKMDFVPSQLPPSAARTNVSVRIRPVLKIDKQGGEEANTVVHSGPNNSVQAEDPSRSIQRSFSFDHVFSGGDQESLFRTIGLPMLKEAYKGFNACLFAYGQTGSGKTYSLLGDIADPERRGIVPRFAQQMFDEAQQQVEENPDLTIKISLSMIEVYMEKIRDLLRPRHRGQEPESLELREDSNHRVYVKDVSVHPILSYERMLELVKQGNASRQTSETKMNETSSRSHAIVQITISQQFQSLEKKDLECTVSLVDLAGSERQTKTESSGVHFEEAKKINLSLLMLGRALNSFSDRKSGDAYISLRESKLTRLLSESFGGNSKTWMLATVSPTAYNLTETISTLEYATNAMAITNRAKVNKCSKDIEYADMLKLREALDGRIEEEKKTIEEYDSKLEELRDEVTLLKESYLSTEEGMRAEEELQLLLSDRKALMEELVAALKANNGKQSLHKDRPAPLIAFSGTCKMSLARIPLSSFETYTLVIPAYDLVGPPPLLQCSIHANLTELEEVMVVVELKNIQHLPDYARSGVQVSLWFEGQTSSRVTTPVTDCRDGNPHFNFKQSYLFGPITDELQHYFQAEVLYFQVDGMVAAS